MSDIAPETVDDSAVIEFPDGTTPPVEPTVTEPVEPVAEVDPGKVLDLEAYGDYLVPVKVNGEEKFVPLSEARSGVMMQLDYTRKTQELSTQAAELAEARAIAEALQRDPAGTLKVLQEYYAEDDSEQVDLEAMDPQERTIHELQQWKAQQEATAAEQALDAELDAIEARHGIPKDVVLQYAVENNIPNLNWAVGDMQLNQADVVAQHRAEHEAAKQARLQAKAGAPAVEGGADRSSNGSTVPPGTTDNVRNMDDAFALARRQLGM